MYYAALHELNLMRIRAVNWFKEQNGGVTVIEIIIILAIVIALGIFFKDQIIDLANSIWNSISGNEANVTNFDKLKSGGLVLEHQVLLVVVVAKLWIDSAKHELILLYGGNCSPHIKIF